MSRNHSQENLFKHVEIENCDNSSAVLMMPARSNIPIVTDTPARRTARMMF